MSRIFCHQTAFSPRRRRQSAVKLNTSPSTAASGERLAANCSGMGSSATQASSPRRLVGASQTASAASSKYKIRLASRP